MNFKYAFNLGRVFTLSLAELFAVFENMELNFRLVDLYREVLIIETEAELNTEALQKSLGGTIKIMLVLDSLGRKKLLGPSQVFADYFDAKILRDRFLPPNLHGKIKIGVSLYPMARQLPLRGEAKRIGLGLKDMLSAAGHSARAVLPQKEALALPSVVVTGENLLEKGAEIDFLVGEERIYLAKTLVVQDFEDYGRRDYQRPARDQRIGMLPPKVAQIMINLSQPPREARKNIKMAVLDPFVGSGTVVQEAIIAGYRAVGSDISEKAVRGAETNLNWIRNRYKVPPGRFEVIKSDVKHLSENLPDRIQVVSVATEGTLGPAYLEPPKEKEIDKNFKELEPVYLSTFENLKKLLAPDTRVVVALPAYRVRGEYRFFDIVDKIVKLGYDVMDLIPQVVVAKYAFLEITDRKSIIYDRKDQFVSREIFTFKLTRK